ncbi:excisionase family DNA-binding protein [Spirochaeta isovalerica]|uniref:Excisionase family DNA binding protein n=1 Tax=Spirochaeta isovalerica TaxID=150 RepID=A0A841RB39_9SPIO|nr:excisionase family DNA binding protein [Spirochaeta isovalerica]
MDDSFYSVESAAEKLDVHSRTVLRFIRDGKLKAVKVGRQWRIRREDLQALTGEPEKEQQASASSVIDLPVSGREEAYRYETLVMAALNSRGNRGKESNHRVDCLYNSEEQTVRFVLWGSISFMKDFFTLIDRY